MTNIEKIIEYTKNDDHVDFINELNLISGLDDIADTESVVSIINSSDINKEYKTKYIIITILEKIIKQYEKLYREGDNDPIDENTDLYNILVSYKIPVKEYLDKDYKDTVKMLDGVGEEVIYDILDSVDDEDLKLNDLYVDIIIKNLKHNKAKLSSFVNFLNEKGIISNFLEKSLRYFEFEFIYKILENDFSLKLEDYKKLSELTNEYFTKDESVILKDLLEFRKIVEIRPKIKSRLLNKIKLTSKKYPDEYQNRYCNKLILEKEEIQDELTPLIVKKTEISLPFRKILKFNKDTLYEVPKQSVRTIRLSFSQNNFQGGSKKYLYNIEEDLNMDLKWYVKSLKYLENLSLKDKMTVIGYTYNGDVYANNYLMNNKDYLNSYLTTKLKYKDVEKFFPLYFQAKDKIIKEQNDILKYYNGTEKQKKNFLEFINNIISDDMEIKTYNLIINNKALLSVDFWIDVVRMFTEDLNRIIKMSPPVESEMIVFRGTRDKYYKTSSNLYVNNTFMSTSFDYKVPFKFSKDDCCLKKIIIKPGSHALFIESLTQYSGESEILLGYGNKFNILEDKTKYYYNLNNYNQNDEYSDNLCSENVVQMEVTVMELNP